MISDIVLPDTTKDEWPAIRARIHARIWETLAMPAEALVPAKPQWEQIERYDKHGLTHIRLKYHVVADVWNEGILVLPEGGENACPAACVFTIHGTNYEPGKYGMIDPAFPNRAYGLDLARRGFATFSPDQYGHGSSLAAFNNDRRSVIDAHFKRWPDWSLDGRRLFEQQRAIDALATIKFIDASRGFGAIGNSLGGRAVIYLAALDERIAAAVPSCGISPHVSNAHRYITYLRSSLPKLAGMLDQDKATQWEYSELIGLCAPRAVLVIEPWNDVCNPDVTPSFQCFYAARKAYALLGAAERLSMLVHGDGHGTTPTVREFAYVWLERFLRGAGR
jgi:dienelactone hydrolase